MKTRAYGSAFGAGLSMMCASVVIVACGGSEPAPAEAPRVNVVDVTAPSKDAGSGIVGSEAAAEPSLADAGAERRATDAGILERASTTDAGASRANAGDPLGGTFTLEQATAGLSGKGPLMASIKTSQGELRCRLFEDKAPVTVANFVGLARGDRPWKNPLSGAWEKTPAYDGTTFHRVIKGFMIQGGDPTGTGRGEPGYTIPDELWGGKHDRPGLLCMANRGPNTNGMQFFITDAKAPHLDSTYTIFGECSPVDVVHKIAAVPTGPLDRPVQDVTIRSVEVSRSIPPVRPGASSAPAPKGPPKP